LRQGSFVSTRANPKEAYQRAASMLPLGIFGIAAADGDRAVKVAGIARGCTGRPVFA
jgi:hypothetical protein